jgi:dimethylargininase
MHKEKFDRVAITRPISNSIAECELTHLERSPINIAEAQRQHALYEQALESLGYSIFQLSAAHDLPDAVFVEDVAIVLPEIAIITRPGAVSRRPELKTIKPVLKAYRQLAEIKYPATLDGGDVLVNQKKIFTGLSNRTNEAGLAQLAAITKPLGYSVTGIPLKKCLHLKTAVTQLSENHLLLNPAWVDKDWFDGFRITEIHSDEPFAANVISKDSRVLCPASCPKTAQILRDLDYEVVLVDQSELAKAEAGLTCCSILID